MDRVLGLFLLPDRASAESEESFFLGVGGRCGGGGLGGGGGLAGGTLNVLI